MLELAYSRKAAGIDIKKTLNIELYTPATVYDLPDANNREKLTY